MAYLGNSPGVASQRIVTTFTATAGQTTFTPSSGYALGYCDVFQNGVKLVAGDDYTAANGTTVVLATGASAGDSVEVVAFIPRGLSDGYTKAEADALLAAKQAALGYTPVNKAGDIMTGALRVNSSSGPHRISVSDGPSTDRGYLEWVSGVEGVVLMNTDNSPLQLGTNGVKDRIKIDYLGRVTMPYQPAFLARGLSNASTSGGTNSAELLKFYEVINNNGNGYNASTGLFTAPVAGKYFFTFALLFDDSWGSGNGGCEVQKNGVRQFNIYFGVFSSGTYRHQSASGVIELASGDTVRVVAGLAGIHVGTDTSFSGYLIG